MSAGSAACRIVATNSTMTAAASTSSQMRAIWRRSKRSATWPTTNTSNSKGRNCARPTKPRASALWVTSYICQPTATPIICDESDVHMRVQQ
jgi:hypothetical protein